MSREQYVLCAMGGGGVKSPAGRTGVQEYESDELTEDSGDEKRLLPKDGHWPRSARRSVGIRLPDLAIKVPVSHRMKFLLLDRPILLLLISSFFLGSPFASVDLNLRTSASVVVREVIGQIQPPAPAALEEPLLSLQAARSQTDDKYKVALQRLGKDEYNLVNLVTSLNDFAVTLIQWNLSRTLLMRLIYLVM